MAWDVKKRLGVFYGKWSFVWPLNDFCYSQQPVKKLTLPSLLIRIIFLWKRVNGTIKATFLLCICIFFLLSFLLSGIFCGVYSVRTSETFFLLYPFTRHHIFSFFSLTLRFVMALTWVNMQALFTQARSDTSAHSHIRAHTQIHNIGLLTHRSLFASILEERSTI